MPHERAQRGGGGLAAPEFRAVVHVEAHGEAEPFRSLARFRAECGASRAERRRDAAPVKPFRARKHRIPIHHPRPHFAGRGVLPVVAHAPRTLPDAGLQKIHADARTAAQHRARVHTAPAQIRDAPVAESVLRQTRDKRRAPSELRELHGGIGLRAAECEIERRRIRERGKMRGGQAKHDFAEADDFGHGEVESWELGVGSQCPARRMRQSPGGSDRTGGICDGAKFDPE